MSLRVRGRGLPGGNPLDLVCEDGVWTAEPVGEVELVIEGWLLPGLADVHTHPGADEPGSAFDEDQLRADLVRHMDAGVVTIRSPGLAGVPPAWFGDDAELPRAFHAGPWLARPGQFMDGWGRRVEDADFPRIAAEQAAATGWCKVVADWKPDDEPVPAAVLDSIVHAVHEVGGRVAVHSQQLAGGVAAVQAGVDSLEHGMCLDWGLLDAMREQGTTLVPTLAVLQATLEQLRGQPSSPVRDWFVAGADRHAGLVAAAHEAGVQVLAGTDSHPCGTVADEVRALAAAGMPAEDAIGAASWVARDFLGLGSLQPGAAADAVVYESDPRDDLKVLDHPQWVVARGRVLRRPGGAPAR